MTAQTIHDAWDHLLQGHPDDLDARAAQLVKTASAILEASRALTAVAYHQHSEATDALQQATEKVQTALMQAERRYSGTGEALRTFAVELAPIQRSARVHIEDLVGAETRRDQADVALVDAHDRLRTASYGGGTDADVDRFTHESNVASMQMQSAARDYTAMVHALQSDDRAREDAADRAIRAIDSVIGEGADSVLDDLRQMVDGAVSALAAVTGWVRAVLADIVQRLGSALLGLVSSLLFAIVVVAAVAILGAILGPLGLQLLAVGVASLLISFVLREAFGTPRHRGSGLHTSGPTQTPSKDAAQDYGDLIAQVDMQDRNGTDAGATDISVVAITDAAGNVTAWRVQLPSTQYWDPFNTAGVNDLSADAMLSLFPGLQTQYEKAVLDAMRRAGVDQSSAPIMFTGWSLGGMMAGKMATYPQYADRVGAVVTAGSAIDKYADRIGPQVNVTQVNNLIDPVHHLELVGLDAGDAVPRANWRTYWIDDARVHNGQMYADGADRVVPRPLPADQQFFADPLTGTREVVYTDRYSRK